MTWKLSPSIVLTLNGGYVDTAGFLSLHGLFVAHVTGNFVTAGAAVFRGTSGAVAELMALPVFCLAVVASRLASVVLGLSRRPTLRTMLPGSRYSVSVLSRRSHSDRSRTVTSLWRSAPG